jgi:tetratricopeptide (TPR) repeat protein
VWLILGVTFLAFSNSLLNGFAYDDTTQILKNPFIRDLRNVPKALVTEAWYWRAQQDQDPNEQDKPSTPYYRPLIMIYLMVIWKLFGTWATGWHVLNVLLHLLAVYLAFLVFEKITKDLRVSAIASLLFAVHPLRSESVAWISGVTDPLLAIFMLTSFYLYVRYREEGRRKLLAASVGVFLIAVFTKEPAVSLPIFVACCEVFVLNQNKGLVERVRTTVVNGSLFVITAAGYFAARFYALGFALNDENYRTYPLHEVVLTIPLVIWKYIGLLLWPVNLSLFHATYIVKTPLDLRFIFPMVGLVGLALALWPLRNSIIARFAVLWFGVNLLPVLNLGAFSEDFLVQERYVYIPSIGFSLLVAMGFAWIPLERWLPISSRRAAQATIVGLLVLLFAGKSVAQNTAWKDDDTVWIHGVETAPDQMMPHFILGHRLISKGEYEKAAVELEAFLKFSPNNLIVMGNLASCYSLIYQYQAAAIGDSANPAPVSRALELCETGLKISDQVVVLWDVLGQIYTYNTSLRNYDRAIACFQRGLSVNAKNPIINLHLGATLVTKKGDYDGGLLFLQRALDEGSMDDAHKYMAYAYRGKGELKKAIDEFSIYLQRQPNAADVPKVSKDVQEMRSQLQSQTPSPQS